MLLSIISLTLGNGSQAQTLQLLSRKGEAEHPFIGFPCRSERMAWSSCDSNPHPRSGGSAMVARARPKEGANGRSCHGDATPFSEARLDADMSGAKKNWVFWIESMGLGFTPALLKFTREPLCGGGAHPRASDERIKVCRRCGGGTVELRQRRDNGRRGNGGADASLSRGGLGLRITTEACSGGDTGMQRD
ncbi:hypothetical protein E2542_SST18892 [Spatholobus suberectus]|nr:hypothetical protein E2542_SST18892 [Spatholobus suberectus]